MSGKLNIFNFISRFRFPFPFILFLFVFFSFLFFGVKFMHRRIYRRKYLGLMVAGTWFGAFGTLIQTWRGKWGSFGFDKRIGSCTILRDKNSK